MKTKPEVQIGRDAVVVKIAMGIMDAVSTLDNNVLQLTYNDYLSMVKYRVSEIVEELLTQSAVIRQCDNLAAMENTK